MARVPTPIDQLAERHLTATLELSPVEATMLGVDLNQDRYDDFSPEGRAAFTSLARETLAEADSLTRPTRSTG